MSINSFIKLCADIGFDGVEIQDIYFKNTNPEYIESVKGLIRSYNLELAAIDVSNDFFSSKEISFGLPGVKSEVERVKKWIKIASKLNTHVLRIFLGFKPITMTNGQAFDKVRASINECLPCAEKNNVYLAPEPHPTYPAEDPAAVLTLLKVINSKFFRVCIDFGWIPSDWKYEAIRLLAPYSIHVHAKAYRLDDKGEAVWTDFGRVFSILKEAQYKGFISVEYEGPGINLEERVRHVTDIVSLIRKHM